MSNAFDALGVHPALGSFFTREQEIAGQDYVVVLNYGYWQQHFAQNSNAIGQTIRIDGISRRIIGVIRQECAFPTRTPSLLPR
jgi:hypothetical protein